MMVAVPQPHSVGYGRAFLAGIAGGIVAAVACMAVRGILGAPFPPAQATMGSAFVAVVLGALLYAWASHVTNRPGLTLWVTSLALANLMNILVVTFPIPVSRLSPTVLPVAGLVFYLQQIGAVVGLGKFASMHASGPFVPTVIVLHYVTAVIASLLIPWWAPPQSLPGL